MKAPRYLRDAGSQSGGIISTLIALLFLVVFCALIYLVRHPIMRFFAESWIVEDTLEHSDAIVVLSDDNFYADRAARAAELFRQGLAPVVVASGRRLRPFVGLAELMAHDLEERGVPKDKIVLVAHDADDTRDEAEALTKVASERGWHSVIVVTSNYHTRRARYIFRKIFPSTITVRVASARDADFDPENWRLRRISIKRLTKEVAGMMVAIWELKGHGGRAARTLSVVGLQELKTL